MVHLRAVDQAMPRDIAEEAITEGATLFVANDGPIATADQLDDLLAAVDADVAIVVSVGSEAAEAFTDAALGSVAEVIGIGVNEPSPRERLTAAFQAHDRVTVSLDDPSDLGEVGQAINRAVSDHVESGQRPVVVINSISALLRHNTAEHVFYFMHLLDGLLGRSDGIGLYIHDIKHHETHEFATLSELVEGAAAIPGLEDRHDLDLVLPSPGRGERAVNTLVAHSPLLWILAILTFGMTDIITTYLGITLEVAHEASPLAAAIFGEHRFGFIYVAKAAIFILFYLLWRFIPAPYNVSIPLGLFILGTAITVWNTFIITSSLL